MFRMIAAMFATLTRAMSRSIALHPAILSFSPHEETPESQLEQVC